MQDVYATQPRELAHCSASQIHDTSYNISATIDFKMSVESTRIVAIFVSMVMLLQLLPSLYLLQTISYRQL